MGEPRERSEPFVLMRLGETHYGVRSRLIQRLEMVEQVTPVPNAPAFLDGVVFSRGEVIPAVNLRARFGFQRIPYNLQTRLAVIDAGSRRIGLIVDTAREFVRIPVEGILPPPEAIAGLSGRYLEGIAPIGERLVLILDVERAIDLDEAVLAAVEGEMGREQ